MLPEPLSKQVVTSLIDPGRPRVSARHLAMLRPVNRALCLAADEVQKEHPKVHNAAWTGRLKHAVDGASREWADASWEPADRNRIKASLAARIRGMDEVSVHLQPLEARSETAKLLLEVLTEHPNLRTLDVTAGEGQLMNDMTRLLAKRPELLRSLDVKTESDYTKLDAYDARAARSTQLELSKVIPRQKNLTVLKLRDKYEALYGHRRSAIQHADLDKAIASLPGLQSLALSGYHYSEDEASALADVLRKLPALEDLDLSHSMLNAAAFAQVASSLLVIPRLQRLNLHAIKLGPGCAEQLGQVLPSLAELRTLNLERVNIAAADMEHLAGGLVGLKQLQTLSVSYHLLDKDARLGLSTAVADMPTLQHLHLGLSRLGEPSNANTLADTLRSLAGHQKVQVHLGLRGDEQSDRAELQAMQAALPDVRFSA